ncbi:transcriptional regulator [Paracoccus sp. (in: a-proteobacteria)]|uniref:helix-turn-helix domain-containing protein n=1 Tax=Paracoccus sp. TaxID=267 RepID=UPI0028A58568|nr:helix-turn-helix domain-containing protein [Paracoccus sp. (in: a-proteobacteria)]
MCVDLKQHEYRKARLRVAGTSLSEIARQLSLSHTSVTVVSQGYRRSARIEAAIAVALGEKPSTTFPDRYPATDGGDDALS